MNAVHLTGTVRYVHVKNFTDYVVVSLKLELPDQQVLWVQVKNLEKAHGDLDKIQKLDGQIVTIQGKLSSRYKKPNPPKYPKERTFYDIATNPSQIKSIAQLVEGPMANSVKLTGKVKEVKSSKEHVYFKLGLRYYNPSTKAFGEWIARIRCPHGFTEDQLQVNQEALVVGTLTDTDGALVHATQVVDVLK